tara:strand:+ start:4712 stop:5596 length:885 start_codon:yes stop_codon:yes gene_type:complete
MRKINTSLINTSLINIVSLLVLTSTCFAAPSDRFAAVSIQTVPVAEGVYMLVGSGGNIGVSVGDDGVLIIDDQFAPLSEKIRAAIAALNSAKPAFVLNTHFHGDHVGGNVNFGADGTIIAHENVRVRMVGGDSPKVALPVVTYDDSVSVYFNGEEIKITHMPSGHTDGDSIVHFTSANVVHMGDHMFNDGFPFVDLGSGGSVQGYITNVGGVLETIQADTQIIPGHGSLATKTDLVNFHAMLTATSAVVRKAMAAGKSLEQIKAQGLGSKWSTWGSGFINEARWIETIHTSYAR